MEHGHSDLHSDRVVSMVRGSYLMYIYVMHTEASKLTNSWNTNLLCVIGLHGPVYWLLCFIYLWNVNLYIYYFLLPLDELWQE